MFVAFKITLFLRKLPFHLIQSYVSNCNCFFVPFVREKEGGGRKRERERGKKKEKGINIYRERKYLGRRLFCCKVQAFFCKFYNSK